MVGKKIKGRKRHIVTDTQGNLLHVTVHAANIHDTKKGGPVFEEALKKYPSLEGACFDGGYRGTTVAYVENVLHKKADISLKVRDQWAVIPVRWVVERTFGWLNSWRRLSKDYEISTSSAENLVMIAFLMILLNRIS